MVGYLGITAGLVQPLGTSGALTTAEHRSQLGKEAPPSGQSGSELSTGSIQMNLELYLVGIVVVCFIFMTLAILSDLWLAVRLLLLITFGFMIWGVTGGSRGFRIEFTAHGEERTIYIGVRR